MSKIKHNGEFVTINNHKIHVYIDGKDNAPSIIFMAGHCTVSPVYDFKILYEKLLDDSLFTGMLDLFSSLIDGISNFIDTIGGAGPALLLLTGILTPFLTKVGAYLTTLLPGFITGTHKKISAL